MFLLWTKIGGKPFLKERVWKIFLIENDSEITRTTTKNKEIFVQT